MSLDINDPKLTAYVLGELDEAERTAVEAEIRASADLRRAVDELRRTSALLSEALTAEPSPQLTPEQRASILQQSQEAPSTERASRAAGWGWRSWTVAAVAASLLLVAGLMASFYRMEQDPRIMALRSQRPAAGQEPTNQGGAEKSLGRVARMKQEQADRSSASQFADELGVQQRGLSLEYAEGQQSRVTPERAPAEVTLDQDRGQMGDVSARGSEPLFSKDEAEAAAPLSSLDDGRAVDSRYSLAPTARAPADASFGQGQAGEVPGGLEAFGGYGGAGYRPVPADDRGGAMSGEAGMAAPGMPPGTMGPFPGEMGSGGGGYGAAQPADDAERRLLERSESLLPALQAENLHVPPGEAQEPGQASRAVRTRLNRRDEQDSTELRQRMARPAAPRQADQSPETAGKPAANEDAKKLQENLSEKKAASGWRRSVVAPHASRLKIGDNDYLPVKGMQMHSVIDGFRARVLVDCYFYNDRNQQLEGTFQLRLPTDASLYYFAFGETVYQYDPMVQPLASSGALDPQLALLPGTSPEAIRRGRADSWSNVKEARVVPRVKAAHAYGEVVRRRVDPALVEWSGAGVFNASVFPLMPGKLHRVVIGYDINLQQEDQDLVYRLQLPEPRPECMVDFNVAAQPGMTAEVTPQTRPFTSGGRAYYHFANPDADVLTVRLKNAGTILLAGSDEKAGDFFATRVSPRLPSAPVEAVSEHALFLVDTSLSSQPEKFNVWRKMLAAILEENRSSIKRFGVLFFSVDVHPWRESYVDNTPENVAELLNYFDTLALEGATDLRLVISEAVSAAWLRDVQSQQKVKPDLFLLSDGAASWGTTNLSQITRPLEASAVNGLFAYQTGMSGTVVSVLEQLAAAGNGAVFSVVDEAEIQRVATAHRQRPWQIADVEVPGGHDLLLAGRPKRLYPGQSLLITGRGNPQQEVVLTLRQGEEEQQVRVPLEQTIASELSARVYGQVAVGQLEAVAHAGEDFAVAYARHFRVPGQTCSLLMLESEADYERFQIKPEDDQFVVKSSQASDIVQEALEQQKALERDAKHAIQSWLAELQQMPGLGFDMSTAFRLALERLPSEALELPAAHLKVKQHGRNQLPPTYLQRLAESPLDYEAIYEEAQRRRTALGSGDGLKVLSNLLETSPGDWVLARDVAFTAMEWGLPEQAYPLLEHVTKARPYEPQTYLAAARCLAEMKRADLAIVYYEVAVSGQWNDRYPEFQQIAATEYAGLLRQIERGEQESDMASYAEARLESLAQRLPVKESDLLVVMMWNTDRTDVDLHVVEPSGEQCYYERPNTSSGGRLTADVTEGYGPEMYYNQSAPPGRYQIKAHYYGTDQNRTQLRSKVYLTTYRDYGRPGQRLTHYSVALKQHQQMQDIATIEVTK